MVQKGGISNLIASSDVGKVEEKNPHSVFLLFSVCIGAFLSHFSAGFVNIALTDVSIEFSASLAMTQWVVNGYLLAIMLFLPFMGKLSDQFGRKKIHNAGYLIFAFGAAISALSLSMPMLIVARILQGIGAAMLQAVNMAIVTNAYPENKRGKALGIISTSVGFGGLLGPSVGGFFLDTLSWHFLFWMIVPISIGAFFLAQRYIPNEQTYKVTKFDYFGSSLFGIGLISIVYVLTKFGEGTSHPYLIGVLFLGICSLVGFFYHSKRIEYPFIHPQIFSSNMVRAGGLILVASYCAAFASTVILPFYLRGILDYSPNQSGLLLMCYPLFLAIFGPISGAVSDRFGGTKVIFVGLLLLCGTMLGLSFLSSHTSLSILLFLFCLLGFSMGILTSPNYSIMMFYVPIQFLGMMSSTIALLRNIGMILGTALAITFMNGWLDGTITEWMSDPESISVDEVMLGFRFLFLVMFLLLLGIAIYFIIVALKQRKEEAN